MAATFKTEETFVKEVVSSELDGEVRLRLKAGAITSEYAKNADGSWTLTTTWNVIGEQ